MKPFARNERVAQRILQELALILAGKVADARIAGITLTSVKVTKDLRLARIYYTAAVEPQERKDLHKALTTARGFLKKELAQVLELKYMPDITFFYDDAMERSERIEAIFKNLQ